MPLNFCEDRYIGMKTEDKSKGSDKTGAALNADSVEADAGRRAALLRMGIYAASVAPAMLVLTSGRVNAQGNGNGNGNGGGSSNANCDNPGQHLGVKKQGHSGC